MKGARDVVASHRSQNKGGLFPLLISTAIKTGQNEDWEGHMGNEQGATRLSQAKSKTPNYAAILQLATA